MSIWSSLDPASATVDPGGAVTVTLRLRNTTDLVEEYRIAVAGEPAVWAQVEPRAVRLYPGANGTAEITFRPPRSPDATAGGHPFAVEVTPAEQPADKAVVEGHLTVTPFTEVRAELLPHTVRGRFRGKPKFAVDNLGNTKLTASLTGHDNSGQLGFDLYPANVQVEPGRAAWVNGRIRPGAITWFGKRESHPYAINVLRSGTEPVETTGVFVQRAVLPGWLLGFLSVLIAAAIACVVAWFAFQPKFDTRAKEVAAPTGTPLPTTPSPTHTPHKKHHSPTPAQHPARAKAPGPATGPIVGPGTTGKCVDVNTNSATSGNAVQLFDCNDATGQRWTVNSDGTLRTFGKCLDIVGNGTDNFTKVQLWDCIGGVGGQQWKAQPDGSLFNPQSGRCLDDPNGTTDNGTQLQIYDCNGQWTQKWKLPG